MTRREEYQRGGKVGSIRGREDSGIEAPAVCHYMGPRSGQRRPAHRVEQSAIRQSAGLVGQRGRDGGWNEAVCGRTSPCTRLDARLSALIVAQCPSPDQEQNMV